MEIVPNLPLVKKLKRIRDAGAQDNAHRTLLICGGGWGAGAVASGAVWALREIGIFPFFHSIVGVSSGAGVAAYALTGDECARTGASVFWDECCSKRFFSFFRNPIADIYYIEWVFRESSKRLDVEAVLAADQELRVAVSDIHTGRHLLLDPKKARPDLIRAVKAALAMPGLFDQPVMVNNQEVADGMSDPLPIENIERDLQPSELMIIANCSRRTWAEWRVQFIEQFFWQIKGTRFSREYLNAIKGRHHRFHQSRRNLKRFPGEVGILFVPEDIPPYTKNGRKLRQAANDMIRHTLAAFGEPDFPFRPLV